MLSSSSAHATLVNNGAIILFLSQISPSPLIEKTNSIPFYHILRYLQPFITMDSGDDRKRSCSPSAEGARRPKESKLNNSGIGGGVVVSSEATPAAAVAENTDTKPAKTEPLETILP